MEYTPEERRALERLAVQRAVEERRVAEVRNDYRSRLAAEVQKECESLDKMLALAFSRFGTDAGGQLSKNAVRKALSMSPNELTARIARGARL